MPFRGAKLRDDRPHVLWRAHVLLRQQRAGLLRPRELQRIGRRGREPDVQLRLGHLHGRGVLLLRIHARYRRPDRPILPAHAGGVCIDAGVLRVPLSPVVQCGVRLRAGRHGRRKLLPLQRNGRWRHRHLRRVLKLDESWKGVRSGLGDGFQMASVEDLTGSGLFAPNAGAASRLLLVGPCSSAWSCSPRP